MEHFLDSMKSSLMNPVHSPVIEYLSPEDEKGIKEVWKQLSDGNESTMHPGDDIEVSKVLHGFFSFESAKEFGYWVYLSKDGTDVMITDTNYERDNPPCKCNDLVYAGEVVKCLGRMNTSEYVILGGSGSIGWNEYQSFLISK